MLRFDLTDSIAGNETTAAIELNYVDILYGVFRLPRAGGCLIHWAAATHGLIRLDSSRIHIPRSNPAALSKYQQ